MKTLILDAIKSRDTAFIKKFCVQGHFITDDGTETPYVCSMMDATEVLSFMHEWDAVLLESVGEAEEEPDLPESN